MPKHMEPAKTRPVITEFMMMVRGIAPQQLDALPKIASALQGIERHLRALLPSTSCVTSNPGSEPQHKWMAVTYLGARGLTEELWQRYGGTITSQTEAFARLGVSAQEARRIQRLPCSVDRTWGGSMRFYTPLRIQPSVQKSEVRSIRSQIHKAVLLPGHDWSQPLERVVVAESSIKGIAIAEATGEAVMALNGVFGLSKTPQLEQIPPGAGIPRKSTSASTRLTIPSIAARRKRDADCSTRTTL